MKKRIENRFVADYIVIFLISTLIGVFAVTLLSFASDVISKNLVNHNYTAAKIMTVDLSVLDVDPVLANLKTYSK